jgi:hypothetical protein
VGFCEHDKEYSEFRKSREFIHRCVTINILKEILYAMELDCMIIIKLISTYLTGS